MLGETLGPYRIESKLGVGGMGTVYLAEVAEGSPGPGGRSRVAIKVLHPHLLSVSGFFKRFLREAEIGKAVRHPNVVRTLDCDVLLHGTAQRHFLVMEYVKGQTLREVLEEMGNLPEELCRHIAREVAAGLTAIHEAGVIHRDLKPENILLTEDNAVKVMDLGVARLAEEAIRLSQTGMFVGSLCYAAPEQYQGGGKDVDGRADLFSLGILLYEIATGGQPYFGGDVREKMRGILGAMPRELGKVNPQVSPFFEEVVHKLLKKDREERFASAGELVSVLEEGEESQWWIDRRRAIRLETRRPLRRIRIPRETAVYGRETELSRLRSLFELARAGEGQVVLIGGEEGIGKSRVVDELIAGFQADAEDLNVLYGSYPPGGAATADGAFVAAYREHIGDDELERALGGHLKKSPSLVAPFAALLRGEPLSLGIGGGSKEALLTAFVHTTRSLARERPTVVIIDDLHLTSEGGRALFADISQAIHDHRVLLVGTFSRGLPEKWLAGVERLPHFTRLTLDRLDTASVRNLLLDAFSSEDLAAELAPRISQHSDGNPYFVFEIIQELREADSIVEIPDGTWIAMDGVLNIEIPASVRDLLRARIAGLDEDERELLDVAACCGIEFDASLAADVLGLPRVPALRRIAHIEAHHRIVRSVGRMFVFDHHQTREVLYQEMPEMLREEYHLALARALESGQGAGRDDRAASIEVCDHYLKGGKPEGALPHLPQAVEFLESRHRLDAAVELIGKALSVPGLIEGRDRLELLIRCAAELDTRGRRDEEDGVLTEAVELAGQLGDPSLLAQALSARGRYQIGVSEFEAARETLEQAHDQALLAGDEVEEARANRDLGISLSCLGRYDEARARHERSLVLARRLGDERSAASAMGNLGKVLSALGHRDEAQTRYEQWLEASRTVGSRRGEAAATGNLGTIRHVQGRYEEARAKHERNQALCREIGYRLGEVRATGWLALGLRALGRYEEALSVARDYLDQARSLKYRKGEILASLQLAELHADLGNLDRSRDLVENARGEADKTGSPSLLAQVHLVLGGIEERCGSLEEAERHYQLSCGLQSRTGSSLGVAEALAARGRLLLAKERSEDSIMLLEVALELAEEQDNAAMIVLASLILERPDAGDRFRELEDRLSHGEKMEACFLLWKLEGNVNCLAASVRLLGERLEQVPEERRAAAMTALPLHREIRSAASLHLEP